ncbi:MAG: ACT domain-containing protein [Patescibacteria group bacterium]
MNDLQKYFQGAHVYIWPEKFAIIKAKQTVKEAFVNIIDQDEITVMIDQNKLDHVDVIEAEKDWRIFTLDVVFPMNVFGVTATIATALTKEKISIMPIAAYSRDHFLIKDKDVVRASDVFTKFGMNVIKK